MRERQQAMWVGLFMLAGAAALVLLLFWFAEAQFLFGKHSYPVDIHFTELTGIQQGTEVRMSIGRIGLVRELRFADAEDPGQGVVVVVDIDRGVKIPVNAEAVAQPAALAFGRGEIQVYPPVVFSGNLPEDGTGRMNGRLAGPLDSIVQPEIVATLQSAADAIARLADAGVPVAYDLDELLQARSLQMIDEPGPGEYPMLANASSVMQRFDQLLKHTNEVIGDPRTKSQLRDTVANVHQMSEDGKLAAAELREGLAKLNEAATDVRELVATSKDAVANTELRLERFMQKATTSLETLGQAMSNLELATRQLSQGDGTAGRLLRDPKLYDEMLLTFQRMSSAVEEMQSLLEKWKREGMKIKGF